MGFICKCNFIKLCLHIIHQMLNFNTILTVLTNSLNLDSLWLAYINLKRIILRICLN